MISAFRSLSFLATLGCAALLLPTARAGIAGNVQHASAAGLDVYLYRTSIEDVVVLSGWFPAGDLFCPPTNPAIATLTAGMLDKGTTAHGKFELAKKLEDVGASISFRAGPEVVSFSVRCLKSDLPLVVSLLAEQLRTPAFAPAEFAKLQQQYTGGLRRQLENTGARAGIAFGRAVFPAGHPNRPDSLEEMIAGVAAAKPEDLRAFHQAHYGPAHLTLVAVGDVDLGQLKAELEKNFTGWTGGVALPDTMPVAGRLADARTEAVMIPGKTSVSVLWGQTTGLRHRDADSLALRAGTAILGSGFTGRLMANVRDKEGLTYGVGAAVDDDTFADGDWSINATFAPELLEKGVASIRRQLVRWQQDGVTDAELATKKINMVGSYQVSLATTNGIAGAITATLQRGRGLDWLDRYPDAVNALTTVEVNAAIKRHLDPAKMALVKAGTLPEGSK